MSLLKQLRSRPGLSTAAGTAFAIIAGLMLLGFVSRSMKGERGGNLVAVPVARGDIAMGVAINDDMLTSRKIPVGYLVPGTIREVSGISGARALRFIGKGEPITASSIAGGKGAGNLASRIPADLRAYSIGLSRASAGCSDLRPGDRVDVLATAGDPPRTGTLLSGRLILSVGGNASGDPEERETGAPTITLLVSPAEAELLAQATCSGEISVSLCPDSTERQAQKPGAK
ncbi:MAG: Flp pilus assembly protein CpaB [Candidatus Geothermincolia bacterium]